MWAGQDAGREPLQDGPVRRRGRRGGVMDGGGDERGGEAGRDHPPAEVDVVAEQAETGVEAAEAIPHVTADEQARTADGEYVAFTVVLALVELVRSRCGPPPAGTLDRRTRVPGDPPALRRPDPA